MSVSVWAGGAAAFEVDVEDDGVPFLATLLGWLGLGTEEAEVPRATVELAGDGLWLGIFLALGVPGFAPRVTAGGEMARVADASGWATVAVVPLVSEPLPSLDLDHGTPILGRFSARSLSASGVATWPSTGFRFEPVRGLSLGFTAIGLPLATLAVAWRADADGASGLGCGGASLGWEKRH